MYDYKISLITVPFYSRYISLEIGQWLTYFSQKSNLFLHAIYLSNLVVLTISVPIFFKYFFSVPLLHYKNSIRQQ